MVLKLIFSKYVEKYKFHFWDTVTKFAMLLNKIPENRDFYSSKNFFLNRGGNNQLGKHLTLVEKIPQHDI